MIPECVDLSYRMIILLCIYPVCACVCVYGSMCSCRVQVSKGMLPLEWKTGPRGRLMKGVRSSGRGHPFLAHSMQKRSACQTQAQPQPQRDQERDKDRAQRSTGTRFIFLSSQVYRRPCSQILDRGEKSRAEK